MLQFDAKWRFASPGPVQPVVVQRFRELIDRMCVQVQRQGILDEFKSYFAAAAGRPYYRSSNEDWASTDLDGVMHEAAANAPVLIAAFYDICTGLRCRRPDMAMPPPGGRVEFTPADEGKAERYAEIGVRELWRLHGRRGTTALGVEFLALVPGHAPRELDTSRVLEGFTPDDICEAVDGVRFGETRDERKEAVARVVHQRQRASPRVREDREPYPAAWPWPTHRTGCALRMNPALSNSTRLLSGYGFSHGHRFKRVPESCDPRLRVTGPAGP